MKKKSNELRGGEDYDFERCGEGEERKKKKMLQ